MRSQILEKETGIFKRNRGKAQRTCCWRVLACLLKLKSDDVYHIGGDIPDRNHGVTDTSLIRGFENGHSFIVGEFIHQEDGSRWIMIVNKDLQNSTFLRPKFADNVDVNSIELLSHATGKLTEWPKIWYSLSPGQAALIKIKTKD